MLTIVFDQPSTDLKTASRYANPVYGSHKDIYQDITILSPITKGKFPLYLINSQVTKLSYVMKVFPHTNDRTPIYFKNETRFSSFRHPNIIRSLYSEEKRQAMVDGVDMNISYTIMENAPYGDFMKFMKEHSYEMTEKLARTYFRQLIEGLEYLHKSGVAHMDLKLDNLLLSEDYTLKIADFDMAHFSTDSLILSNGSKFFRSPEVSIGKCNNPKASDIFSAGVILFSLMTRGTLPQFEKELIDGINFADLLANDVYRFWTIHSKVQKTKKITFDEDFKELFEAMTKLNPNERASIEEIKASKWYNKPYYCSEELINVMERVMRF